MLPLYQAIIVVLEEGLDYNEVAQDEENPQVHLLDDYLKRFSQTFQMQRDPHGHSRL